MGLFAFEGVREDGKLRRGVMEADSPQAARRLLRQQGIYPSRVEEARPRKRLPREAVVLFFQSLAVLMGSGMPLVPALAALEEQEEGAAMKGIIAGLRAQVSEGKALSAAMGDYPFPAWVCNLIAAAEASGTLDVTLLRLADGLEKAHAFRRKALSAFLYPAFMVIIGTGVLAMLLAYVVPRIVVMFEQSRALLPWPTRLLLAASDFLSAYGPWLLVLFGLLGIALWPLLPRLRPGIHRMLLHMPLVRGWTVRLVSARLARTLGLLLGSGVPLVNALRLTAGVLGNEAAARGLLEASREVEKGRGLAASLKAQGFFPPLLIHMIASGEASGALPAMLDRAAGFYEEAIDAAMGAVGALLEPILIVIMGFAVGFVVLAVLWPIFEMSALIR